MTVFHWLGQACFVITTLLGSHLLIDPVNPQVGYHIAAHSIPAQIVFVSHDHFDHNYTDAASGSPTLVQPYPLEPVGAFQTDHTRFTLTGAHPEQLGYTRLSAYHDNEHGTQRGQDTLTVVETGGLRVCHLGDLGELQLTPAQVKAIGRVDVLMIPVGGFFTIDGTQAAAIVAQLHPRVILPMHYGTPALSKELQSKLAPASVFLAAMRGKAKVVTVKTRDLALSPKTLPKTPTIYLLRYQ